ncbi:MAG: hypothetical protein LKI93_05935 [Bifidobacteriaceae bacterium]|nr:hypothetical protein [Bifidobacteriaceae bacterium]MCI1915216.1 hypothetical protein [Bifidobacteriaceae bacterium]
MQLGPKSVVAILSFSFAILSITFSSLGLLWAAAGIGTGIAGLWDTSSKKAQRGTDSAYRSGAVPPQRGQAKTGRGLAIAGIVVSVVGAAIWWFFILIPMVKAVSDFAAFSTSFPWWRAFL